VAAVSVNSDTDPIAVTVSGDTEFSASQPGNYTALVNAGSSNVTWTWNANDGTPVEHGQTFTHQFARAGKYNVQCTIADIDGLKKPVTGSFTVVVQAD
jgi:plastocyanin